MPYNCCSGNFSSPHRCHQPSSTSSCGSSYPSNLVYSTTSCSPNTCQLDSTLHSGCWESCIKPTSCQRSCVVSSPCQSNCYYPRSFRSCSPCQPSYAGSLGFGPSTCYSRGYGSRSCYSGNCGSSGFRSRNYGFSFFPSLNCGSRFYFPTFLTARTCQPSCYIPTYGCSIYGLNP